MKPPWPAWCAGAVLAACLAAVAAGEEGLEFHRVHVPQARLDDVPLGPGRYVPLPLAEFETAVSGATALRPVGPRLPAARYRLARRSDGTLAGTLAVDVEADDAGGVVPIGPLDVRRVAVETTSGQGEGVAFVTAAGQVALRTPESGTYACDVACAPVIPGVDDWRLPLVPAHDTEIVLDVAAGMRPVIEGTAARRMSLTASGGTQWRIRCGTETEVRITLMPAQLPPPGLVVWNDVAIRGGQAEFTALVEPTGPWAEGPVVVEADPEFEPVAVATHPAGDPLEWSAAADGRITVLMPAWAVGQRMPVEIRGLAAAGMERAWPVPLPRVAAARWKGGGARVVVDSSRAITAVGVARAVVVTPEEAARWPLPRTPRDATGRAEASAGRARPATLHVEMQEPDGAVTIALENRPAELDTARVTTVEVSPGAVLGRAACDVRVVAGAAFALSGKVMPGWIIDSVEAVEWVGGRDDAPRWRAVPASERGLDWRIARAPTGNTLRIGLSEAATPSRGLGLRITGHRPGIPLGGEFTTGDMDMIRLDGESAATALVDVKVGPEALVEIDGTPTGWLPADNRLAPLVEEGPARARMRGGERQPSREARVVQRRPPVDARVQVRLTARDDVLAESFTFECVPQTGRIDAIVVHFSEPMTEDLDWSALVPTGIRITARRLDANDSVRGTLPRGGTVAESWLVEITPPIDETTTFRASRAVPFTDPLPVPLAWVEGAVAPRGVVAVRSAGAVRAGIRNRRLRELPPGEADTEDPATSLGEFAYGPPQVDPDGLPPADVVPERIAADARAWAWRESTNCWCHDSGGTEAETTFDVENHGRESVTISVAGDRVVDAVLVDGVAMPLDDAADALRVALPVARRRVRILVRTLTRQPTAVIAWRVDPIGCAIDVPVLERDLRVLLPPDLEIAALSPAYRRLEAEASGWSRRLFAADLRALPVQPSFASAASTAGFEPRRYTVAAGPAAGPGLVVVRRRFVSLATACAALVAAGFVTLVGGRWRAGPILLATALAIATLWSSEPVMPILRGAWWGAAAAAVWPLLSRRGAVGRPRLVAAAALLAIVAAPAAGQDVDQDAAVPGSLPVFITTPSTATDEPPIALVPERLFRVLAGSAALPAADCRVMACRVAADTTPGAAWELELALDCDAGGLVTLRQPDTARWVTVVSAVGVAAAIDEDGRGLRLSAAAASRGRVVVRAVPALEERGELRFAALAVPPATAATLVPVDGRVATAASGTVLCEIARGGGAFTVATPLADRPDTGFDIARADRVRLVTGAETRLRFATTIRLAESENEVTWDAKGCRVDARFTIDVGSDVIAAVVLRADAPLEPVPGDGLAGGGLTPLGSGRYRLEFEAKAEGSHAVSATFRMPLEDPVGSFMVPGVWLEGVTTDVRTVRCRLGADLVAVAEPPQGASPVAPRDGGDAAGPAWRYDVVSGAVPPRGGLVVERRRPLVRGVQNLAVEFAADNVALRLQAQFDAVTTPLVQIPIEIPPSSVVDRVAVFEEGIAPAEAGGPAPVDMLWERTAPDRIVAVLQQPRAGRFGLEVDVRVPIRPATRGRLPLVRAAAAGGAPLFVTWGTAASSGFAVAVAADEAAGDSRPAGDVREVTDGEPGPAYELVESSSAVAPAEPPAVDDVEAQPRAPRDRRVELTDVFVSLDASGRTWGMVRFDVITTEPTVEIRFPAGMRLYDLLVDGREAGAVPRTPGAWEVRLHDVSWPRSIVAVFAGDLTTGDGGQGVRIEPPRIANLPCRRTLWTIVPPAGYAAEIEAPAIVLDDVAASALRLASARALDDDFRLAVAAATGAERDRLQAFTAARESGVPQSPETLLAGNTDGSAPLTRPRRVDSADAVTVRVVAGGGSDRGLRGIVTAVLAGCGLLGAAVVRRSGAVTRLARALVPLAWVIGGGAWTVWMSPALPGWCAITVGLVALMAPLLRGWQAERTGA